MRLSLVLFLAVGCIPATTTDNGKETEEQFDNDGDGFVGDADCDEEDGTVHDGAAELCDGLDNDCNGTVDDGATNSQTFYLDSDADQYGDPGQPTTACAAPVGYVATAGDCNDADAAYNPGVVEADCADPNDYNCDGSVQYADEDGDGFAACEECDDATFAVHPGAVETCNNVDDDCNSLIDDNATDGATFYVDADGDGYGTAETIVSCEQPADAAVYSGDCDDADTAYHPNADEIDCTDPNDYNCDGSVGYDDKDSDGYPACEECDDASAAHFPGAPEYCDGVDDDCDKEIDEADAVDATRWYADADADTFGNVNTVQVACDAPSGYVSDATDCDDSDVDEFPGAFEHCDGDDDNCDGVVDEATAVDASIWYMDADTDGYGDPATSEVACDAPSGYLSNADDCDDTDLTEHPGATEYCDGDDDNCDGVVDEATAADAATWYADSDADGYGDVNVTLVACDQPGGYFADLTDCDDSDAAVSPAGEETCNGVDDNCDGDVDEALATDAGTWFADNDGDGYGDPLAAVSACGAPVGYVADSSDCDDTNASAHPGASEACDGFDDDCDGVIDEDASVDVHTWFLDTDGDGYGDAALSDIDCDQPTGYVADATDCDDAESGVNPGEVEVCDSADVDEDCSGAADDMDTTATGQTSWYTDADSDGYGLTSAVVVLCDQPVLSNAAGGDCDDGAALVHPGATELAGDSVDQDCDGTESCWVDADSDGYRATGTGTAVSADTDCADAGEGTTAEPATDCDDAVSTTNPGASESCNGHDDDCDGLVDEDASVDVATWFVDADADGYGNAALSDVDCDQPSGYVANATDCDDGAAGVNPGATELCDAGSVDEDCSGLADDADSGATGQTAWYADGDGDGYGDAAIATMLCDIPAGTVANSTDCDDGDADINPGEAEVCDAANVDEDCNGLADDVDPEATGQADWFADSDSDGYGDVDMAQNACDQPASFVADDQDCDDSLGVVFPGATETLANGRDDDCDGTETCYDDDDNDGYVDTSGDTRTSADGDCSDSNEALATAATTDCDDTTSTTHPGAAEACNGVDDNCDLTVDEGVSSSFYMDADLDGYGDPLVGSNGCAAPSGYVANGTDCDDGDPDVNPGEAEVCDPSNVDEDCNELADDDDPGTVGLTSWYADADTDTYGDPAVGQSVCDQPASYVADASDCDDTRAAVNPAAAETLANGRDDNCDGTETCYNDDDNDGYVDTTGDTIVSADGDCADAYEALSTAVTTDCNDASATVHPGATETCNSVDDNCDGTVDEGVETTYYADADADAFGDAGTTTSACSAPSGYVADSTDCDDTLGTVYPGAPTVCEDHEINDCNGTDSGCERVGGGVVTSYASTTFYTNVASDGLGQSLAKIGDIDGDGLDDIFIGTQNYDTSSTVTNVGRAWLYSSASVSGPTLLSTSARAVITGVQRNGSPDWLAMQLSSAGDFDSDGHTDVFVGAPNTRGGTSSAGAGAVGEALIFSHPNSTSLTRSDATVIIQGVIASDNLGTDLIGGDDWDNDGKDDVAAGAYLYDVTGATNAGGVVVARGGLASGTYAMTSTNLLLYKGESTSDQLGQVVGEHSDLNGDGIADLLMSAYKDDNAGGTDAGSVYIIYGGTLPASTGIASAYDSVVYGQVAGDTVGRCAVDAGDLDGDGSNDLLVGADGSNGTTLTGRGYVFLSPVTGANSAASAHATFSGSATNDFLGRTCDGNGDFNGDGNADVLIGGTGYDSPLTGAGGAWMWYGPVTAGSYTVGTADFSLTGTTVATSDAFAGSLAFIGDTDNDGFDDILAAAQNWDGTTGAYSAAGGIWLVLGTGN